MGFWIMQARQGFQRIGEIVILCRSIDLDRKKNSEITVNPTEKPGVRRRWSYSCASFPGRRTRRKKAAFLPTVVLLFAVPAGSGHWVQIPLSRAAPAARLYRTRVVLQVPDPPPIDRPVGRVDSE